MQKMDQNVLETFVQRGSLVDTGGEVDALCSKVVIFIIIAGRCGVASRCSGLNIAM
jgi:hypothetical protein